MKGVELFVIVLVVATALGAIGYLIAPDGVTGLQTFNSPPSQTFSSALVDNYPFLLHLDEVFFDAEGDLLTYSVSDNAVLVQGNVLAFTAAPEFFGDYTITITVSDGQNTVAKPFTFILPLTETSIQQPLSLPGQTNETLPRGTLIEPSEPTPPADSPSPTSQLNSEPSSERGTSEQSISVACTDCTDCSTCLGTSGQTCTLSGAISSTGTCITGMASNTNLDCAGFTLTYNTGGGDSVFGIVGGGSNISISDCDVIDGSTAGANTIGLVLIGASNVTVNTNTIRSNGTNRIRALELSGVTNARFTDNIFLAQGTAGSIAAVNITGTLTPGINFTGNILRANGTGTPFGLQLNTLGSLYFENNTIMFGGIRSSGSTTSALIGNNSINGSVNLQGVLASTISNNTVENNTIMGTVLIGSSGTIPREVHNNRLIDNSVNAVASTAVTLSFTNFSLIQGNTIATNGTGISVSENTINATIDANTITTNGTGDGISIGRGSLNIPFSYAVAASYNVTTTNTINGRSVFYYGGAHDSPACPNGGTLTSPAASHIHLLGCNTVTVQDWDPDDTIVVINSTDITLERITSIRGLDIDAAGFTFRNSSLTTHATAILANGSDMLFERNTITFSGTNQISGAYLNGNNIIVRDNVILGNSTVQPTGIRTDGTGTTGNQFTIINNTIDIFARTGGSAFALDWDASNSTIENNFIRSNGSGGCCMEAITVSNVLDVNVIVHNNTIISDDDGTGTCCNYAINGAGHSWRIDSNTVTVNGSDCCNEGFIIDGSNVIVNNNTLAVEGANCCHYGLDFSSGTRNNQSVTNNLFTVFGFGVDSDNFGIYFGTVDIANITNNTVSVTGTGNSHGAISLNAGIRVTAQNNTLFVNGTNSRGIWLTSTSNHNLFVGNNVSTDDGATYALSVEVAQTNNSFVNTTLNNTQYWINTLAGSTTQFNNTRFLGPNSSVNITSFSLTGAATIGRNNINVFENRTFVNTANVSALNGSGIVQLNNVPFTQPRPRVDTNDDGAFAVCTLPECTIIDPSNTTFIYSTTHFTSHASAERISADDCPFLINGTYTLTQNITCGGTAVIIQASNLVLDCAGFNITYDADGISTLATPSSGIRADGKTNVTIRNCNVNDTSAAGTNGYGIDFISTNTSNVINNIVTALGTSNNYAVRLSGFSSVGSENNLIENNTLASSGATTADIGIVIEQSSDNNAVRFNNITTNGGSSAQGILLATSGNNTLANNSIRTNGTTTNYGITLQSGSNNNSIENNTVTTAGSSSANNGMEISTSSLNTIRFNRVFTNGTEDNDGIRTVSSANNNVITNNTVYADGTQSSDAFGIHASSSNNTFANNTGYARGSTGGVSAFIVFQSTGNTVESNTLFTNGTANGNVGGVITQSSYNNFTNNTIYTNGTGNSNHGIRIDTQSNSNAVLSNNIYTGGFVDQHHGIRIEGASNSNNISNNFILTGGSEWGEGILVSASDLNIITYNRIFANSTGPFNYGIGFDSVNRTTIAFNNITTNGTSQNQGIKVEFNSYNNNVSDNRITTDGTGNSSAGIVVSQQAENNTFRNNVISTNGLLSDGVRVRVFSNNTYFINTTISTNGTNSYAVILGTSSSGGGFGSGGPSDRAYFNDTRLVNVSQWIQSVSSNTTLFYNTTFENINGSINIPQNFSTNGNVTITKQKLNIFNNQSFLNSTNLSILNTSARITLNSLLFTNPQPIVDYEDDGTFAICTIGVDCDEESYIGGTFVFNTSHFTSHAASETVSSCPLQVGASTTLGQNITCPMTAVEFVADNVVLDCAGNTLTYDTAGNSSIATPNVGVSAQNRNNVTVQNCAIVDGNASGAGGYGILYNASTNSRITNNSIQTNGTSNNYGIYLNASSNHALTNNSISTRGSAAFNFGVYSLDSPSNLIEGNTIITNGTTQNAGVFLQNASSTNNTVSNNSISTRGSTTANAGVVLVDAPSNLIEGNTISTNGTSGNDGITLVNPGSTNNTVQNNSISTSGSSSSNLGVSVVSAPSNLVEGNIILTNGTSSNFGVSLQNSGSTNNTVFNNSISTSGSSSLNIGIGAANAPSNSMERNTILTNGLSDNYGIFLQNSAASANQILNNTIATRGSGANNYAIYTFSSPSNFIEGNTILTNGTTQNIGVFLQNADSTNNTILNNSISTRGSGSTNSGVGFSNAPSNLVQGNVIFTNGTSSNDGVSLINTGSTNNTIFNNSISTTGSGLENIGIRILSAPSNTIERNTISTNGTSDNDGIAFVNAASSNNTLSHNLIITTNGTTTAGLFLGFGTHNNTIQNTTILSAGTNQIHLISAADNTFANTTLNGTTTWMLIQTSTNNTFENTTFNSLDGTINIIPLVTAPTTVNVSQLALNIQSNNSFLNSTNLSFLNTTAQITLRGLTFIDPSPFIDVNDDGVFATCSSPDCDEVSYAGGTFVFNVSHFTSHAASETVVASACPVYVNTNSTLGANISCPATTIIINSSNLVFDCLGYNISFANNASGAGINATNTTNVTVQNCNVFQGNLSLGTSYGILYSGANNSTIRNTTAIANGTSSTGIHITLTSNATVIDSTAINNATTALLITTTFNFQPTNNTLINVRGISNTGTGISISASGNYIYNSTGIGNGGGISLGGNTNTLVGSNGSGGVGGGYGIQLNSGTDHNLVDTSIGSGVFGFNVFGNPGSAQRITNSLGIGSVGQGFAIAATDVNLTNVTGISTGNAGLDLNGARIIIHNSTGASSTFVGIQFNSARNSTVNNSFAMSNTNTALRFRTSSQDNNVTNVTLRTNRTWLETDTTSSANNITNILFDNVANGSILVINLTTVPVNTTVGQLALNTTLNRSFLNSSNTSFLNTSAQITLRGITFTDPRPRVDFEDDGIFANCHPPQCTEISYAGGVYVFNVSSFTSYAAQENLTFVINLSADKTDSPDPVARGGQLSYTITLNNSGNGTAYNVTVLELYPAETSFVNGEPTPSGNDTFSVGELAPGASFVVNITVNVSSALANGTLINNTVNVSFSNDSGENFSFLDSELTTVLGAPVLVSIKSDTPDPVVRGSTLNYSILINNTGDDTAFNVSLTETYPAGVSFVTAQPTPTGNNTFAIGTLAPNESFIVNITVTVGSNVANGTILNNSVNASWRNVSGQQGGVSDSELTTVLGIAALTAVKTDTPDPVNNGSVLSYTITITNTGDEIAYNVTAVDGYPANVSLTTTVPAPTSGNDTFTLGDLLPGASTTINITVTVDTNMTAGVLNNTVNATFTNISGVNETTSAFQSTTVTTPGVPAVAAGGGSGGGSNFFRNANVTREQPVQVIPVTWPTVLPTNTPPTQEIPAPAEQLTEELSSTNPGETLSSQEDPHPIQNESDKQTSSLLALVVACVVFALVAIVVSSLVLRRRAHPVANQAKLQAPLVLQKMANERQKRKGKHTTDDLQKLDSDIQQLTQFLREFDKKTRR